MKPKHLQRCNYFEHNQMAGSKVAREGVGRRWGGYREIGTESRHCYLPAVAAAVRQA